MLILPVALAKPLVIRDNQLVCDTNAPVGNVLAACPDAAQFGPLLAVFAADPEGYTYKSVPLPRHNGEEGAADRHQRSSPAQRCSKHHQVVHHGQEASGAGTPDGRRQPYRQLPQAGQREYLACPLGRVF